MSVAMAITGAGVGLGVHLVGRNLRHPTNDPRQLPTDTSAGPAPDSTLRGWQHRLGTWALGLHQGSGAHTRDARLRILDKDPARHAYEKVLAALAGLILPNFLVLVLDAAGRAVSPALGLGVGAVLAVAGYWYPDVPLAEQVDRRQRGFRHALSAYLDLVTIIIAGGGGIDTALRGAADAGDGWAFHEIRGALRRAELTGRTPWDAFDELGATLDVGELSDLAASISLTGGHGARIRQSLTARADALRAAQAADIERLAEAQSERMILPVTIMLVGLTLFIGFGAVDALSTDGGAITPAGQATP